MTNRKTFLVVISLIFLLLAVVILGWGIIRKTQLDASSANFSEATLQSLFSADNEEALVQAVSDQSFPIELREELVRRMLYLKRQVGSLEAIDAVFGSAEVSLLPFQQSSANYDLSLSTVGGKINANLELDWADGYWIVQQLVFTGAPLQN